MATSGLKTKGRPGTVEARGPPGLAEKTPVNSSRLCTGSPPWPSAGYLAPTRAPWMPPTCQATSTSSCSASTVGTPEAEGCCSTASWNLQSLMPQFATRTSRPTRSRGSCPQTLRVAADIHPVWRCLTKDGHGDKVPNQADQNAKVPEGSAGPQFKNMSVSRAKPVKWRAQIAIITSLQGGAAPTQIGGVSANRRKFRRPVAGRFHPANTRFSSCAIRSAIWPWVQGRTGWCLAVHFLPRSMAGFSI